MKKLFILLFDIAFGIYPELLEFAQRVRLGHTRYQVQHHEYYELTIPHPSVGHVMEKLYAEYLENNNFNIFAFMSLLVEVSKGCLMQVNLGAPGANGKQRFIARELGLFFDGRIDLRLKYLECLRGHGKGNRPYECIGKLIDHNLKGVHCQHAKSATYFLNLAKHIAQVNYLPVYSSLNFFVHQNEQHSDSGEVYVERVHALISTNISRIADDRRTMLAEISYAVCMLRYLDGLAAFQGNLGLTRTIYKEMRSLEDVVVRFTNVVLHTEYLPTLYSIRVKDKMAHVHQIVAVGVHQKQRLEKDVMQVFIKDTAMTVSFPFYYQDRISSIIAAAKEYLQGKTEILTNPMSLHIPRS